MHQFFSRCRFVQIVCVALALVAVGFLVGQPGTASAMSAVTPSSSTSKTVSFHVLFAQTFVQIKCPVGTASTTYCLSVAGTSKKGEGIFDDATFTRTAFLTKVLDPSSPPCNPASTTGKLTTAHGDTFTFEAHGTFCKDVQIAAYVFVVTGGTGKFQGASGSGIISVPRFTGAGVGSEIWDGTLTFQEK